MAINKKEKRFIVFCNMADQANMKTDIMIKLVSNKR